MTDRERLVAAAAFVMEVNGKDEVAMADFVSAMYLVAHGTSHTTSEFGVFVGGVWTGYLNALSLMGKGYKMPAAESARARDMAVNEVIVDKFMRSWYRAFLSWKDEERKVEEEEPAEYQEFLKKLATVTRAVSRDRN